MTMDQLTRKPRSDADLAQLLADLGMPMHVRHLFEKAKLEAKAALGEKYTEKRLWGTEIQEIASDGLLLHNALSGRVSKKRQRISVETVAPTNAKVTCGVLNQWDKVWRLGAHHMITCPRRGGRTTDGTSPTDSQNQ